MLTKKVVIIFFSFLNYIKQLKIFKILSKLKPKGAKPKHVLGVLNMFGK